MGTSSIKATLIEGNGNIVSKTRLKSETLNPREGYFEVAPEKTWWNGFKSALKSLCDRDVLGQIEGICVSSVCGTFVPVDTDYRPVYNAILYGIDTRAVDQIERLNGLFSSEYLRDRIGGEFTTHAVIPKVLWLKENLPDVYDRAKYFLESNNFVSARLTGKAAWDFPTAAGTRLLDFCTLELPREIVQKAGLDGDKFPDFVWPLEIVGRVTREAASESGLREGTSVVAGACDINGEAVACGAINPGDMVVVFGSTTSTLMTSERMLLLEGFTPGVSILEGTYRLGAATSSGGRFLDWMATLLDGALDTRVEPEPTGLIVLPYIDGARAPFDNPAARGVIFGLSKNTSRESIMKAAVESLGYELNLLAKKLRLVCPVSDTFHVLGGLAANDTILQTISNVTGKRLMVYRDIDASYGDALMALSSALSYWEIEKLKAVREHRESAKIITPDSTLTKLYRPLCEKFEALYANTKELL